MMFFSYHAKAPSLLITGRLIVGFNSGEVIFVCNDVNVLIMSLRYHFNPNYHHALDLLYGQTFNEIQVARFE